MFGKTSFFDKEMKRAEMEWVIQQVPFSEISVPIIRWNRTACPVCAVEIRRGKSRTAQPCRLVRPLPPVCRDFPFGGEQQRRGGMHHERIADRF